MTTKTNKKTARKTTTKKTAAPLTECGISRRLTNKSLFPVDAAHTMVFASVPDGRAAEFLAFYDSVNDTLGASGIAAAVDTCIQYFGAVAGGGVNAADVRRNDVFNVLTAITGKRNPRASRELTRNTTYGDVPKIAGGRPTGKTRMVAQCATAARAYIAVRDNDDAKRADALGATYEMHRSAALSLSASCMTELTPDQRAAHVDGLIESAVAQRDALTA